MGRFALRAATVLILLFLYVPILIIILYSFNASRGQTWPITEWTTKWYAAAFDNSDLRDALVLSVQAALGATALALVLGTLASLVVHRFRFFGRDTISFALLLPLALPGIVTGMALNATFNSFQVPFSVWTIIVGHATFCVVTVFNNMLARLRRSSPSIEEASKDLGATSWQTFRHVTFPTVRTALFAGGLLAFGLSFDEVIVTTFTAGTQRTLPIWILNNLKLPNQRPIVNVVAVIVILLSFIPVYVAVRLTRDRAAPSGRA